MKISHLQETTVASMPRNDSQAPKFGRSDKFLETSAGATGSGSVASVSQPVGGMQRRGKGSIFSGIKTSKKFPNTVKEAEISENDLIMVPGQGKRLKPGFIAKGQERTDHEVEMARSDLLAANKSSKAIYDMIRDISEEEGLPGWVQEKLIKANDYLTAVKEYLEQQNARVEEANKRSEDDFDYEANDERMLRLKQKAELAKKHGPGRTVYNKETGKYSVEFGPSNQEKK
jgi:hypothetical protein